MSETRPSSPLRDRFLGAPRNDSQRDSERRIEDAERQQRVEARRRVEATANSLTEPSEPSLGFTPTYDATGRRSPSAGKAPRTSFTT